MTNEVKYRVFLHPVNASGNLMSTVRTHPYLLMDILLTHTYIDNTYVSIDVVGRMI
jgi:hypothetical protein